MISKFFTVTLKKKVFDRNRKTYRYVGLSSFGGPEGELKAKVFGALHILENYLLVDPNNTGSDSVSYIDRILDIQYVPSNPSRGYGTVDMVYNDLTGDQAFDEDGESLDFDEMAALRRLRDRLESASYSREESQEVVADVLNLPSLKTMNSIPSDILDYCSSWNSKEQLEGVCDRIIGEFVYFNHSNRLEVEVKKLKMFIVEHL